MLRRYRDDGWLLVGMSWQPEIADGTRTPEEAEAVLARMRELLDVDMDTSIARTAPGRRCAGAASRCRDWRCWPSSDTGSIRVAASSSALDRRIPASRVASGSAIAPAPEFFPAGA